MRNCHCWKEKSIKTTKTQLGRLRPIFAAAKDSPLTIVCCFIVGGVGQGALSGCAELCGGLVYLSGGKMFCDFNSYLLGFSAFFLFIFPARF